MNFAFATAILKIETLRMRRRFARVSFGEGKRGRGRGHSENKLISSHVSRYDFLNLS